MNTVAKPLAYSTWSLPEFFNEPLTCPPFFYKCDLYSIGVDISKETLAICVRTVQEIVSESSISNTMTAIKRELKSILKSSKVHPDGLLVCIEYTGQYIYPLVSACSELGIFVCMEDPSRLKLSIGLTRGKNDRIDARKFCIYAGLVPFSYDSGTSIRSRSRISQRANQQIKALLHMSAVNVSTKMNGSEYKEYYDRKVAESKP